MGRDYRREDAVPSAANPRAVDKQLIVAAPDAGIRRDILHALFEDVCANLLFPGGIPRFSAKDNAAGRR